MCQCLDGFRGLWLSFSLQVLSPLVWFLEEERTVLMGGGERNTKAMALDTGILNLVRAVSFPPYSPSNPPTPALSDTNNPEDSVSQ